MPGICQAIGEIDRATAPAFKADLHDTIDNADVELVVVDCTGVTFMDSAGYHVLVDATEYAVRHGHTLEIRNLSAAGVKLLRLCDLGNELRFEAST